MGDIFPRFLCLLPVLESGSSPALLHLDFQEGAFNNIGGTQIHVKELTMALRDEYNVFVAARDEEYLRLTIYTDKDVVSLKFEIGEAPKFPVFRDEKMRKIYEQILLAFDIDMVHIQQQIWFIPRQL